MSVFPSCLVIDISSPGSKVVLHYVQLGIKLVPAVRADDRAPFKIEQSAVVKPLAVQQMKSGNCIASLLLASLFELLRGRERNPTSMSKPPSKQRGFLLLPPD